MKTKLLALVSFLLFFSSCTSVVAWMLGVDENYESVTKQELITVAWKKHKIPEDKIIIFDSVALDTFGRYPFKASWDLHGGAPAIQFAMYDTNNMMVSNYGTCEGSRKFFGVWDMFPPLNVGPIRKTKLTFNEEVARWRTLEDEKINPAMFTSDYKLVVYWATFSGRYGEKLVKQAKAYIKEHSDKDIQLILVNNDSIVN